MENMDLKSIERKAYLSYSQDGLYDILAGFVVITIGLQEMNLDSAITPFFIVGLAFFPLLKKTVTVPRLGYAKFSPARSRTVMTWRILVTAAIATLVILTWIAWLVPNQGSPPLMKWAWQNLMFVGGIFIALIAFIAGMITGIKRLYAYAILTWAIYGTGFALEMASWKYILTMGAILFVCGIVLLIQFIIKHPIVKTPDITEEGNNVVPS